VSLLTAEVRAVLDGPYLGHLVTVNADGSPQVSIVWIGLVGDEIQIGHFSEHLKVRNVRRDPRVALSVETGVVNDRGLHEYLVVHGDAYVTEGGALELLRALAKVYLGPDVVYREGEVSPPGWITHIRPTRIHGVGAFLEA
jgi:PPOX class probable F420-dependent enzyme